MLRLLRLQGAHPVQLQGCILIHCTRRVQPDRAAGCSAGFVSGVTYDEITLPLRKGDVFVFCSGGIFEAMNDVDEEFGARRCAKSFGEYRHQAARRIVDAIFDAVTAFQRGAPRQDDMTAVAVKITGKGEIKS